jgi:large subunit ribosomal protein L22
LTPKKVSPVLRKAILSAVANVKAQEEGGKLENAGLLVRDVRVDGGPMQKRIRPRAQGRAYRILKRTSHIKVVVAAVE